MGSADDSVLSSVLVIYNFHSQNGSGYSYSDLFKQLFDVAGRPSKVFSEMSSSGTFTRTEQKIKKSSGTFKTENDGLPTTVKLNFPRLVTFWKSFFFVCFWFVFFFWKCAFCFWEVSSLRAYIIVEKKISNLWLLTNNPFLRSFYSLKKHFFNLVNF